MAAEPRALREEDAAALRRVDLHLDADRVGAVADVRGDRLRHLGAVWVVDVAVARLRELRPRCESGSPSRRGDSRGRARYLPASAHQNAISSWSFSGSPRPGRGTRSVSVGVEELPALGGEVAPGVRRRRSHRRGLPAVAVDRACAEHRVELRLLAVRASRRRRLAAKLSPSSGYCVKPLTISGSSIPSNS